MKYEGEEFHHIFPSYFTPLPSYSFSMKTIAIDCRFAATQSGLGRYTRELMTRLTSLHSSVRYVVFVRSQTESWLTAVPKDIEIIEADFPHYSLAEHITLPSLLKRVKADLLFSPHFNVPFFCPVPFVVTIHDLILHRFPNDASFLKQAAYKILMARAVRKAKRIFAVSHFTESEIRETYGKRVAKKIRVVHEGVSDLYQPADTHTVTSLREKYHLSRPYFLYVGNAKEHKNVRLLIDAFVRAENSQHELILVSGGKEADALTLPLHVRRLTDIADVDLPALYTGADALFTATLYEGFCLPVAEALACGCPVVATDIPVLAEIADGHATLIGPTLDAFTKAMQQSYRHQTPYRIGRWDDAAKKTEAILLDIAGA